MTLKKAYWGVSYELPDNLYDALREMATKEGKEVSEKVYEILKMTLEKDIN